MDLRDRRELNNGFGNALAVAVELVATPMIFGFFGFLVDNRFGTKPIFTLVFFLFVFAYVMWKQYALYGKTMDREQSRIMGGRRHDAR